MQGNPSVRRSAVGSGLLTGLSTVAVSGTAALGFSAGAVAGLAVIAALIDHGVVAFGWGLLLNGAIALAVPALVLVVRRGLARVETDVGARLVALAEGVALPFALQGLYV